MRYETYFSNTMDVLKNTALEIKKFKKSAVYRIYKKSDKLLSYVLVDIENFDKRFLYFYDKNECMEMTEDLIKDLNKINNICSIASEYIKEASEEKEKARLKKQVIRKMKVPFISSKKYKLAIQNCSIQQLKQYLDSAEEKAAE